MNKKSILSIALLSVFMLGSLYVFLGPSKNKTSTVREEPRFRKDKDLAITRTGDSTFVLNLDIEVADDDWEITQGLMYRSKMAHNAGMLFIFPDIDMRSFWMKNTIMPLDIIFIGPDKRIVTIQRYTTPFSEQSVPSSKPAQYVLEVNAGYSDTNGLKEGDLLSF
jgi:uncharacterized protein